MKLGSVEEEEVQPTGSTGVHQYMARQAPYIYR